MTASRRFITETLTVPAGGRVEKHGTFQFLRLQSASGAISLEIDGQSVGTFAPGLAWYDPTDTNATFTDIAWINDTVAAVQVEYSAGHGFIADSRAQFDNAIRTKGGGQAFTDNGAVSVGTAAVLIIAANTKRTRAVIRAGSNDLWIGPAGTVTATGVPTIAAGAALEVEHTAAIYGVRAVGTNNAGVYEEAEV
jgi:hypothetical protein